MPAPPKEEAARVTERPLRTNLTTSKSSTHSDDVLSSSSSKLGLAKHSSEIVQLSPTGPVDTAVPSAGLAEGDTGIGKAVLRGCENESATTMAVCQPWTFIPNIPAEAKVDKHAYNEWRARPTTAHLLFTASEGLNPDKRVNRESNSLRALH